MGLSNFKTNQFQTLHKLNIIVRNDCNETLELARNNSKNPLPSNINVVKLNLVYSRDFSSIKTWFIFDFTVDPTGFNDGNIRSGVMCKIIRALDNIKACATKLATVDRVTGFKKCTKIHGLHYLPTVLTVVFSFFINA